MRPPGAVLAEGVGVHQTALYDMLSAGVLFGVLFFVMMRRPRREGMLTLTFGLWYGLSRIVEDSLRIDKRFFGFTGSQWTALTVVAISAALLVWFALARDLRRRAGEGLRPTPSMPMEDPATASPTRPTRSRGRDVRVGDAHRPRGDARACG